MSGCGDGRTFQAIKSIEERNGNYIYTREFTYDGGKLKKVTFTEGNEIDCEIAVGYDDGKVSHLTKTEYYYTDSERVVDEEVSYRFSYEADKPVRLTLAVDYPDTNSSPDDEYRYDFTYEGDRIKRLKELGDGNYQQDYSYDGDKLDEMVVSMGRTYSYKYHYDGDGRVDQVTERYEDNSDRWELEFDGDGRVADITGTDNRRWMIEYGDNGLIRTVERSFSNRVYTVEYEDFAVEGFTFMPMEVVPSVVADVMDFAGYTHSGPDLLSEIVSLFVIAD